MEYEAELTFAINVANDAGKIMLRYFRAADNDLHFKSDDTPLTIADTTINALVIQKVAEVFTEHGVRGEEDSFEPTRDFIWVVDPIDGTTPYSLGIPISTFSLALVDRSDGQAVVAVTYDPFLDCLYTAVKNQGAHMNGKPIRVSAHTELLHNAVAVVGGMTTEEDGYFKAGIVSDTVRARDGRAFSFVSHVYGANRVASGELIAAVIGYGSPWDSAAVSLIVQEAGGIVTDVLGKSRRYDEFGPGCLLSANQSVHDMMIALLKDSV